MTFGIHQKIITEIANGQPKQSFLIKWPYSQNPKKVIKAGLSLIGKDKKISCHHFFNGLVCLTID